MNIENDVETAKWKSRIESYKSLKHPSSSDDVRTARPRYSRSRRWFLSATFRIQFRLTTKRCRESGPHRDTKDRDDTLIWLKLPVDKFINSCCCLCFCVRVLVSKIRRPAVMKSEYIETHAGATRNCDGSTFITTNRQLLCRYVEVVTVRMA